MTTSVNTKSVAGWRVCLICAYFIISLSGCGQFFGSENEIIPELVTSAPSSEAVKSLERLSQAEPAMRDMMLLTHQFRGIDAPGVAQTKPVVYEMGELAPFWVKNLADGRNRQIEARLVYQSADLLVWVEGQERIDVADTYAAFARLEQEILPATRAFFGTEWQPGVDGDNRLTILHATDLGDGVGAYFASGDEVVTAVNPYSNQREMLYVNLDATEIGDETYYATIAHELQHLIHWHIDRNEDNWLNEGLAELAGFLNGYEPERAVDYVKQTDLPLTHLSQEPEVVGGHYAAAYLFALYFYERMGAEATQALVGQPQNGLAGVEAVLAELGSGETAVTFFGDWLADSYLAGIGEATPYSIEILPIKPQTVNRFPAESLTAVHQFGADYYEIESDQPVTLIFTGTQQTPLVAAAAHSGDHVYASLAADESDMRLTRPFDLSELDTATLKFWTWYDIEAGWDYAYVAVSADDGETWELLETESTTMDNPQGNSLGAGYTGQSGEGTEAAWAMQTADLSSYAGQEIWLRFQYVTDGAVHGPGFVVDDIALPELGYADDAETDGGWLEEGMVRTTAVLPQQFLVQRIMWENGAPRVEQLSLDENQRGQWEFPMDSRNRRAILIVSGVTAVTQQSAVYAYTIK